MNAPQQFIGGPLDGITFDTKCVPEQYAHYLWGYGGTPEGGYDGKWEDRDFFWVWSTKPQAFQFGDDDGEEVPF